MWIRFRSRFEGEWLAKRLANMVHGVEEARTIVPGKKWSLGMVRVYVLERKADGSYLLSAPHAFRDEAYREALETVLVKLLNIELL